jgi:hypothetical protein
MPPWLDWLDWLKWDCVGAWTLGKILGLWFGLCISIVRKLFRWALTITKSLTGSTSNAQISHQVQAGPSFWGKLTKIAVSTHLTVAVWVVITWKPVWLAAGPEGDRLLTVVLIFTSAAWPISLLWILRSKPVRTNMTGTLQMGPTTLFGIGQRKSNINKSQV